jgi:hypothetical protein
MNKRKSTGTVHQAVDDVNIHEEGMLHDPAKSVGSACVVTKWPVAMAYVRYFALGC